MDNFYFLSALKYFRECIFNVNHELTFRYINLSGSILKIGFINHEFEDKIMSGFSSIECNKNSDISLTVFVTNLDSVNLPRDLLRQIVQPFDESLWKFNQYCKSYNYFIQIPYTDAMNFFNSNDSEVMFFIPGSDSLPFWELGAPLRSAISRWAVENSKLLLHAAAVGENDNGILIMGKGGAGKSTTAVNCLSHGMQYVGDDYVLFSPQSKLAYNVYSHAKLVNNTLLDTSSISALNGKVVSLPNGKKMWHISKENITPEIKIHALLFPKIIESSSSYIVPSSKSEAMLTILQNSLTTNYSLSQLPELRKILNKHFSDIPYYSLNLGYDTENVYSTIKEFIDNLNA